MINKDPNKIVNNIPDKTAAPRKETDAAVDGIKNGEDITSAGGKEPGTATENVKPDVPPTAVSDLIFSYFATFLLKIYVLLVVK